VAATAMGDEIKRAAPIAAPPSKNSSSCLRDQNQWTEPVTTTTNRGSHMTATAELRGLVTVEVAFTDLTSDEESPPSGERAVYVRRAGNARASREERGVRCALLSSQARA
jgi:hypothetical protein